LVAYGAIVQLGEDKADQTETKTVNGGIAQPKGANLLERFSEKGSKKQFLRICTIAQKPT